MKTQVILFDTEAVRPGCVLLQAAANTDFAHTMYDHFSTETWSTDPTNMKLFEVDDEQLKFLVKKTHDHHGVTAPKATWS